MTAEAAATIHKDVMNVMEGVYKIGGPVMSQDTTGSIEVAKKWYTVSNSNVFNDLVRGPS